STLLECKTPSKVSLCPLLPQRRRVMKQTKACGGVNPETSLPPHASVPPLRQLTGDWTAPGGPVRNSNQGGEGDRGKAMELENEEGGVQDG
ncbi:COP9 signalosome complex subunit 2, partial [Dissostichus eleginoides]